MWEAPALPKLIFEKRRKGTGKEDILGTVAGQSISSTIFWVIFPALQVLLPSLKTFMTQIFATQSWHQIWQKVGGVQVSVLNRKYNSLFPPFQQQEVYLKVVSLVPSWCLSHHTQKCPNYYAEELGKDGFYVVLSPKHSIIMGLFICFYSNVMLFCN